MLLLGTTFSHRFAEYLSLDSTQSLHEIIALKFNIIRLCCYWDEIQRDSSTYDFSKIKQLLDICNTNKQNVILTVGMKAPRWPEYHTPVCFTNSASKEVLTFIKKTVEELTKYECVKYWQVENEPLEPIWPNKRCIEYEDLIEEVSLIRKLDPSRKIIINVWGNSFSLSKRMKQAAAIADIVGLDLYYQMHIKRIFGIDFYKGPWLSENSLKNLIATSSKPIWITELQAEPWERGIETYKSDKTKSMNPDILKNNFEKAKSLNPEAILFWGAEYWLWRKKHGDDRYIEKIRSLTSLRGTK